MAVQVTTGRSALLGCDLVLSQGADNDYVFEYGEYQNGVWTPYNLTGWSARSQMRDRAGDGVAWITLSTVDGTIVCTATGQVRMHVDYTATNTEAWDTRSRGVWDLELTSPEDVRVRLVEGVVKVSHDVTRA